KDNDNEPDIAPLKEGTDEEMLALFQDVDTNPNHLYTESSIAQEPEYDLSIHKTIKDAALIEFYKKLRPGEPPQLDNARTYVKEQIFDARHYDLENVGRYKLNQKLDLQDVVPMSHRTITAHD